jgi:hypothetical protein
MGYSAAHIERRHRLNAGVRSPATDVAGNAGTWLPADQLSTPSMGVGTRIWPAEIGSTLPVSGVASALQHWAEPTTERYSGDVIEDVIEDMRLAAPLSGRRRSLL